MSFHVRSYTLNPSQKGLGSTSLSSFWECICLVFFYFLTSHLSSLSKVSTYFPELEEPISNPHREETISQASVHKCKCKLFQSYFALDYCLTLERLSLRSLWTAPPSGMMSTGWICRVFFPFVVYQSHMWARHTNQPHNAIWLQRLPARLSHL